jgi:hypothetical protein
MQKFILYLCFRQTLDLVKERDRAAEGRTYGNLGNTYYLLGDFESAVECHTEVSPGRVHSINQRAQNLYLEAVENRERIQRSGG